MKLKLATIALLLAGLLYAGAAASQPLRVFIRASAKTHGPGEHDYPQFLQDWKKLLKQRGAVVNGALEVPTAKQLEKTDVLVMYCSDGSSIAEAERARLDAFASRGGGIVALHDAICGTNAAWLKTLIGGAKQHGVTNWQTGAMELYFGEARHPITEGVSDFGLNDELFYRLQLMPETKGIALTVRTNKELVPQMWVYENGKSRAFVSLQGHKYASFSLPHYRGLVLRGIAWAGRREVDLLTTAEERERLRHPQGGPSSSAEAVKRIKVPPDFDLSLVASEPLVVKPISLDWDARGRMWVAIAPGDSFQTDRSPTRPSLLILEDSDGDGRLDKRRVFYEAVTPLSSFVFYRDGVIVAQASQLLWLRDSDGDDVADKKEVLYDGLGAFDAPAVFSSFRWSLDGWVYATYASTGDPSTNVIGASGRSFGKIDKGVIRFKPDGSAIEVVASYGGNSGGLDFSWDGELFFSKSDGPHVAHVVVPERLLAGNRIGNVSTEKAIEDHQKVFPLFTEPPLAAGPASPSVVFTAVSGAMIYDGAAWPMKYLGSYFVCDPTAHVVHEDIITATESASYEAIRREEEEFIAGTDRWFRPVHTRFGPDGAMYLLDFYDAPTAPSESRGAAAGPGHGAGRLDRDQEHGRIWRLQHQEARRLEMPPLSKASGARLAQALEHPNGWVRMTAQRLLMEKQDLGAVEKLSTLITNRLAYARVHALWSLYHLGALTETNLMLGVTNGHPAVQRNALRIVEAANAPRTVAAEKTILKLFKDTDDRTRLHALLALRHAPLTTNGLQAAMKLFPDLKDAWSKSAVLGLARGAPMDYLKAAFVSDKSESFRELAAPLVEAMAQKKQSAQAALVVRLAARHPTGTEKLNATVLQSLTKYVGPDFAPQWSEELEGAVKKLFASKSRAVQVANLLLAAHWKDNAELVAEADKVCEQLFADLQDAKLKDEERNGLLTNLVSVEALRPRLVAVMEKVLAATNTPAPIQKQIVTELGRMTERPAAEALIKFYPRLAGDLRQQAFSAIAKRAAGASLLLEALEQGALRTTDLGAQGISRLRHYPDPAVARRAGEVIDAIGGSPAREKEALIARFKGRLDQPFNRQHGKEMFKQNCAICHKLTGEGKDLGPDLTGAGLHDPAVLLTHILDPDRVTEGNFIPYYVATKKQENYYGLLTRTNKDSVTLRALEGDWEIPRAAIASIHSAGSSLMPEGFEILGEQTLRDIIGYLADKAPKGFRPLELAPAFTADSRKGLYEQSDTPQLELKKFGVVLVDSVPFDIASPAAMPAGKNLIVLQGGTGLARTWPRRVEVAVNTKAAKLHVLGGVAGWGYPGGEESGPRAPAVRLVLHYVDGETEEIILKNGEEFADYASQVDVPGSKYAPGLVAHGQLRWFTLAPKRNVEIKTLVLESYNNHLAPTFVALTAQVAQ